MFLVNGVMFLVKKIGQNTESWSVGARVVKSMEKVPRDELELYYSENFKPLSEFLFYETKCSADCNAKLLCRYMSVTICHCIAPLLPSAIKSTDVVVQCLVFTSAHVSQPFSRFLLDLSTQGLLECKYIHPWLQSPGRQSSTWSLPPFTTVRCWLDFDEVMK